MEILIWILLMVPAQLLVQAQDQHYAGGSMTFKFVDTSKETYKLQLTIITGWTLGQGPCGPVCTINDIGRSTNTTRNDMLDRHGHVYFGNWTSEVKYGDKKTTYHTLTEQVNSAMTGEVAAVNEPLKWEQEIAEVIVDINPASWYTDISLLGKYWKAFSYGYLGQVGYHLQVKAMPHIRNDTGEPNNSPVAIFKPVYKVLLNSETTIKLSTMDNDDDIVVCQASSFIAAGKLKRMPNTTINEDCKIIIKAYEPGFKDENWGVLAVTIKDFNREAVALEGYDVRPAGERHRSLSEINVQFMIQTLRKIDAPQSIEPTKESQHVFYVYISSSLEISLHAKPEDPSSPEIDSFHVRSVPRRVFTVPQPQRDPNRSAEMVKFITVTWRPEQKDIGQYVLSALVMDELGTEINVIKKTAATVPDINISAPEQVIKDGNELYRADVTFTTELTGLQTLCLVAIDDKRDVSEEECLNITMLLPDPCEENVCRHGRCLRNQSSFICECSIGFTGAFCEIDIDECASQPCLHGATCYETVNRGQVFCLCVSGYAGSLCETNVDDCKDDSCSPNGVCKDMVNDVDCDCYPGYSGDRCEIERLTSLRMDQTKIEKLSGGLSAALVALAVVIPAGIVGVASIFIIKHCCAKCFSKNLAKVSPIDSQPELVVDADEEEENEDEETKEKKLEEKENGADKSVPFHIAFAVGEADETGSQC